MSVQTVSAVRDISVLYSLQSLDLRSQDKSFHFLCPPVLSTAFYGLLICNDLASLLLRSLMHLSFPLLLGFSVPQEQDFTRISVWLFPNMH